MIAARHRLQSRVIEHTVIYEKREKHPEPDEQVRTQETADPCERGDRTLAR